MYKLFKTPSGLTANAVIRLSNMAFIPFDPANTDFIEYQKWLELGNTPLPAENE
jgi:hypothetical protein